MNFKNITVGRISKWTPEQLDELYDQITNVDFPTEDEDLAIFDVTLGTNGTVCK